jgi:hypothetical protein
MASQLRIRYEYRKGQWTCTLATRSGRHATGVGRRKADAYRAAYDALYGPHGYHVGPIPPKVRCWC